MPYLEKRNAAIRGWKVRRDRYGKTGRRYRTRAKKYRIRKPI